MRKRSVLLFIVAVSVFVFCQSVKPDESIEYVAPALHSQREVKNPRESSMGDELIRTYLMKGNLGLLGFAIENETLIALLSKKEKLQNSEKSEPVKLAPPKIVENVKITAYSSCNSIPKGIKNYKKIRRRNGTGTGLTKSGKKANQKFVAADPRYYPEGTVFYVPKIGKTFTVKDTGEKVKGEHHIDLYIENYYAAIKWGNYKYRVLVRVAQK